MDRLTLNAAFCWECEGCNEENFHRAELKEFANREEKEYYADKQGYDVEDLVTGNFLVVPELVQCHNCNKVYEVAGYWASA